MLDNSVDCAAADDVTLPDTRVEDLLNATTDCVYVLDEDWRFIFANDRAFEELGASKLLGKTIWVAFPDTRGSLFELHFRRAVDGDRAQTFEAYFEPLRSWYEVHAVPFGRRLVVFFRNITERRLAAEALDQRRIELDLIFSQALVGIMQRDLSGRVIMVNDYFCQLLGRSPQELDGLPFEAFTHPDDVSSNLQLYRERLLTGTPFQIEKRYVRPDGDAVWCSVNVSFVRNEAGEVASVITVAKDLTAKRAAEEQAAKTQDLLQTVVDSVDDLIFVKDMDGRFVLVNRALSDALGSLVGHRVEERFELELAQGYAAADRFVIDTGTRSDVEEIIPVHGRDRVFQTIKVPWRQGGEILGIIGSSRDITDRLAAERSLREQEERYRLAARATNDAIWDWDLQTDQVEWNEAAARLAGEMPASEARWWKDRIHPDDRPRVLKSLDDFVAGKSEYWQSEYRFRRTDNTYAHVFDRGFLIRDGDTAVRMVGAVVDLTERDEAQARVRQLQTELIHVGRVSAMGTMASALAHELNQPLGAANNFIGAAKLLLEQGTDGQGAAADVLDRAAAENQRAGEIIRRLRRMVERGEADMRPTALLPLISDAIALAIPKERCGLSVSIDIPNDAMAEADPIQVQQVLINLLRNASEAVAGRPNQMVRVASQDLDHELVVSVADNGPGIAPTQREKLFTAFSTSKADGLGVGLSICRTIVEAHGGRIWAEDSPNGGAVLCFTLRKAGRRPD